jgi:hypothetical protein
MDHTDFMQLFECLGDVREYASAQEKVMAGETIMNQCARKAAVG